MPISHSQDFGYITSLTNVNQIKEDSSGLLWFSGTNGLYRFDGESVTAFTDANQNWSLPFIWINDIDIDNGMLYLASETSGVWQLDTTTGKSTRIANEIPAFAIENIAVHNSALYYIHLNPIRLFRIDLPNASPQLISDSLNYSTKLLKTKQNLYAINQHAAYQIKSDKLIPLVTNPIQSFVTSDSTLFIKTDKHLIRFDKNSQANSIVAPDPCVSLTINKLNQEVICLTDQGVFNTYHPDTLLSTDHSFPAMTPENPRYMFADSSGVIWLSNSKGVNRISQNTVVDHPLDLKISNNYFESEVLEERLLLGSYGQGLFSIDPAFNAQLQQINQTLSSSGKRIFDLLVNGELLYVATADGINSYQINNGQLTHSNSWFAGTGFLKLRVYGDKMFAASDGSGLYVFDINSGAIFDQVTVEHGLTSGEILDVILVNDKYWLSATNNINIYDPADGSIRKVTVKGENKIASLINADNKVFAFTKGSGATVFNSKGDMISQFGNGIDFSSVSLIDGMIWAPATHGLYQISPENYLLTLVENTQHYTFTDAPVKLGDLAYIPHKVGAIAVPLQTSSHFQPKLVITKTIVSGQTLLYNKSLELGSSTDVVTLEVASLDYRPGKQKKYRYRINDKQWHNILGNQLTLTGLSPGQYNIEFMATNSIGQWSNNIATTAITVSYPWYWSPVTRIIYFVALVIIIIVAIRLVYLRNRSISVINHILSSDNQLKGVLGLQIAANVNNALQQIDALSVNDKNTKDMLKSFRATLADTQQKLESLSFSDEPRNLTNSSLRTSLEYLTEYYHDKFHTGFDLHYSINEQDLPYELQADIYRIVFEAVQSAILNHRCSQFVIKATENNQKIWLAIKTDDSCFVRYASKINFNISMYFIRKIADKYQASLNTFDNQQEGSELTIIIPLMALS